MKLSFLARLAIVLAALLSASGLQAQAPQPISPAARVAWGFDQSDLPPHPGVRFGVLANGMRYAVMPNSRPSGALSVRLHMAVGARMERAEERGFAHLIEHLLFHGTRNIPDGSLPLMLAHRGMRHWSDVNGLTGYDDTVYRLDMARADAPARDAALLVMRDVAANLLFTRRGVAAAKQKVVEEIAARNAIADAAATAENAFLAPGTPIARGTVAGTVREVRRASASALRRFYERFYTPDRATLIVVGDFDPELAEREIAARFDGWAGKAPPHASAQLATLSPRQTTEARLFVNPAAPTAVVVAAALPVGGDADVGRRRDAHFLERLGSDLLARRLRVLSPGAEAAVYDHFGTVRVARIELAAPDRDWRRTLKIASVELSSALETGFRQEELDAVLGTMRSSLVRDAAPRSTAALADGLADAVGRKIVFTAPADPAGTDLYLSRVRLANVNAAFRAAWAPSRLIFITHNRMVPDGERTILAAWEESLQPRTEKAPPSVQQPK